ncbi:putative mediator of RNA polymerase II transcription subunit 17 isoform X2 [Drosophila pseudoobscura]|uniref:Mediator of RNA polymerase II transcription subunit 17 isoform X2 n=1 Tax=Drosophila pseudoobscura pseudoobscura TaxID=46245 RepID=A0A6I8V2M9_DROPS|nr:putative mediator of RNA polymerase II transcription subunit 17 isoform X2 [Drosophila pseudoobscura]
MRAFIVMCLVAVACADKLGYNYQPVGHSNSGLSFAPGSGSIGGGSIGGGSIGGGSIGGGSIGGGSIGGGSIGGGSIGGGLGGLGGIGGGLGGGSIGGGSLGGGSIGGGSLGGLGGLGGQSGDSLSAPVSYNAPAPAAELEKEFFTFSANEQDFDEPQALERVSSSLNKALRVVFIKGPENRGLENAALALAKQAAQQETAIYVLNKQADIGDLANKLNAIRSNNNNKPEVHFVKYRTPEDAANAQRAIQGQYDQLGGSSQAHNGGVAPVLNFASAGPVRQATAQNPDNSYLPSSVFRRV